MHVPRTFAGNEFNEAAQSEHSFHGSRVNSKHRVPPIVVQGLQLSMMSSSPWCFLYDARTNSLPGVELNEKGSNHLVVVSIQGEIQLRSDINSQQYSRWHTVKLAFSTFS